MATKTIRIKSYVDVMEEMKATEADILPGMLVEEDPTGTLAAPFVKKHATAEGNSQRMFAVEDEAQGNDIDDLYAINNPVQVVVANRGDWIFAFLNDGENVAIGDDLASAGNGRLQKHVPDDSGGIAVEGVVAKALEAIDMSDSSGVDPSGRIKIRVY